MCCIFNCLCNSNCRPRPTPIISGSQGPIGPQGPQGAQGPQGLTGLNNSIYAGVNTQTTVATNTIIPIAQIAQSPSSGFTVSNSAVNLPSAGTYLVSYFVNGSVPSDNIEVSLYLNGSAVSGESIELSNTTGDYSAGSKTILITTTSGGTLSLYNTSSQTATLLGASLTVTKIA